MTSNKILLKIITPGTITRQVSDNSIEIEVPTITGTVITDSFYQGAKSHIGAERAERLCDELTDNANAQLIREMIRIEPSQG
jgi:hypothetical protein